MAHHPVRSRALSACALFCLWGLAVSAPSAEAGVDTATFQVSANVQATCVISVAPMSFGTYTGLTATATTTISVVCTNTTPYTIGLDAGVGVGCSESLRCLTQQGGTAQIEYSLYHDAAYSNVWTSTNVHNGVGTGVSQAITIYGRARGEQFVEPDPYYDTVTATINF